MQLLYASLIKILPPIKEILEVFIGRQFEVLSVPQIAKYLKREENTIIQRLRRDTNKLFITTNTKPMMVSVKPGNPAIILLANRNQCRFCDQKKDESELTIQFRRLDRTKEDYNNIILVCKTCLQNWGKSKYTAKKRTDLVESFDPNHYTQKWEYKEILIEQKDYFPPGNIHPTFEFYVFQECAENNDTWNFIAQEGIYPDNIASRSIVSILNAFGDAGWELINLTDLRDESSTIPQYNALFKRSQRLEIQNLAERKDEMEEVN